VILITASAKRSESFTQGMYSKKFSTLLFEEFGVAKFNFFQSFQTVGGK